MNVLEQELQDVNATTVRMLSMVRESVQLAKHALVDAEPTAAERCIAGDREIDAVQRELESRCLTIIARRQPAAGDLRFLGAVVQALADIERAGDYAAHVARAGAELAAAPRLKKYLDMARILVVLDEMLETTMRGLAEGDVEAARHALAMDEEIDELYEQIQRELLTYMMADPHTINAATKLLAVARYLERCGDHIENVNEHVIFWLTGQRV
ncbi:MAG: phosphate signaling complex protein PhoU [Trueperaceae bacterium]|nr:phosphate signaling complex protein PhoU [Trueperaceae bacterium]